ncbi:ammonium transporter [Gemmatimonadetes bacterium T265]|nr:ammonium transporter [Gemmatimonadetes bacterium T265]
MIQTPLTPPTVSAGDTAWILVSTALVMVMVPGLAFFYGGLVRGKSALNTMLMSIASLALVSVQWILCGYSLAFAPGSRWVGGLGWRFLSGVGAVPNPTYAAGVPHVLYAGYQAMFAGITIAIVSGAIVERMRFPAYLAFALLWSTFVYDPLAHWVWGDGGWLKQLGALDFAGGTVVHISAGAAALVAAVALGRRRGIERRPPVPHNVPFVLLGAGLLWFGWFGFNAGSALAADGIAANALVTTHVAASSALLTWLALEAIRGARPSAVGAATGAVVGLVAITPAAGYVTPGSAIAIGVLAAAASFGALHLRARTRVDDSLDVFACHGVGGIVGALLTGVFATKAVNPGGADGLLAGNPHLLAVQALAVLATLVWAGALSVGILALVHVVSPLRVSVPDEIDGVDVSEHGESAYQGESADLAGRGTALGGSVYLPPDEVGVFASLPVTPTPRVARQ